MARHSSALLRVGLVLDRASLVELAQLAVASCPEVILIHEEVYAFDPKSFEALAVKARAGLVILGDENECEAALMRRLERALACSAELREEEHKRPTVPAPPQIELTRGSEPSPTGKSGIRPFRRPSNAEILRTG